MLPLKYPATMIAIANKKAPTIESDRGSLSGLGSDITLNSNWTSEWICQWYTSITHEFVISWFKIRAFDLIYGVVKTHVP